MEIELEIVNLDKPQTQGEAFSLVLQEKGGNRFVPVVIGLNEARALLMAANSVELPRPLTHDLILQAVEELGGQVVKVCIVGHKAGIYFTEIAIQRNGESYYLDSRLSDAAVIAFKCGLPILIEASLFDEISYSTNNKRNTEDEEAFAKYFQGATQNDDDEMASLYYECLNGTKVPMNLSKATDKQLQILLEDALERENYELAAEIDKEVKSRQENGK